MNSRRLILKITFYDKILISLIFILAIILYWIFALNTRKSPDDFVAVRQNGVAVLLLSQDEINKDGIYDFEFDGGRGQIEVKDKKVRMLPMDKEICPNAICSNTGWIDGNPKKIVCAPNRLVVSFISNKGNQLDGIVH